MTLSAGFRRLFWLRNFSSRFAILAPLPCQSAGCWRGDSLKRSRDAAGASGAGRVTERQ
ncbi:hypothetical protein KIF59_19685 [Enterobacter cloacae subsp. cloacae]|nr:hypothetical protein [Enterobacter cloacae subsp. cloacae]